MSNIVSHKGEGGECIREEVLQVTCVSTEI
jgi:hypothetical protein